MDPEPAVIYGLLLEIGNKPTLDVFLLLNLLTIAILLFFSALVSGSEVAYFSLEKKELIGNKEYIHILSLLEKPKKLLATILILNNLVNIAIVTLMTYSSIQILGNNAGSEGFIVAGIAFTTTFIIVFFGEVLPKVYAIQNNLSLAQKLSKIFIFFNTIFTPFSWLLITFTNIIEKSIHQKGMTITKKELSKAIEITSEDSITNEEKNILKGIVNFGQISAKQIMLSRIDVSAFDIDMDFHEVMDKVNKWGFSRYPVYEETIDNVKGILYIKDLLPHIGNDEHFEWKNLIRPAYFIPETKMIDDLLDDFKQKHIHMAIVVDEYGGTSGVVTLEDVIEEIVGEINDEFDDEDVVYTKIDENTFVFEGKTSIHDFCKIVEVDLETFDQVKGENESLGGLMLELFSKFPQVGNTFVYNNFKFFIQSVNTKRVKKIRVELLETHSINDAN